MEGKAEFIIRVYALIINENGEVLISDEYMLDMKMTKFPGGGMRYGEGPIDCLKREALEEFGQEIRVREHFYTTDYFQPAYFYKNRQLVSIYYLAELVGQPVFRISGKPFDFPEMINGSQSFRWVSIPQLEPADMSFPIDQKVVRLLKDLV